MQQTTTWGWMSRNTIKDARRLNLPAIRQHQNLNNNLDLTKFDIDKVNICCFTCGTSGRELLRNPAMQLKKLDYYLSILKQKGYRVVVVCENEPIMLADYSAKVYCAQLAGYAEIAAKYGYEMAHGGWCMPQLAYWSSLRLSAPDARAFRSRMALLGARGKASSAKAMEDELSFMAGMSIEPLGNLHWQQNAADLNVCLDIMAEEVPMKIMCNELCARDYEVETATDLTLVLNNRIVYGVWYNDLPGDLGKAVQLSAAQEQAVQLSAAQEQAVLSVVRF